MIDVAFATVSELVEALGQRLRAQRIAQSMTQAELAMRAGVSSGAIKTLESTGMTSLDTIVRVIRALGLVDELADLLTLKPTTSIAAMEKEQVSQRQRVRHPLKSPPQRRS
ncbi:helix-turn-helix domain-containing protein [Xanthomonas campestris]|uniref:Helix-turn-helix transcriptional regulator n=1 Tax=Xanthomonas campestris pv. papavericola TaxID=487881 RepID=A0AAJ2X571_XANCA|nr:helix-turn-helix transcriptional regulator [Xanthomonas campestris]MEC3888893.1 helix-turn-helix transcriptional regulator [Xanthomonas campestris pv. papavericola]